MNRATVPCAVSRKLNAGMLLSLSVTSPRTGRVLTFGYRSIDRLPKLLRDRMWAGAAHGGTASFTIEELGQLVQLHRVIYRTNPGEGRGWAA
jgi:hypothetical protein